MTFRAKRLFQWALIAVVVAGLWLAGDYNYLLFHSVVEIVGIVVAAAMFAVAWYTRRLSSNGYLTFLGIAYLFVAILDLVHALSYKGMGVLPGYGADLPTQLWVAARSLEGVSLLLSPIFLVRPVRDWLTLSVYAAAAGILLVLIVPLRLFPACYVESGPHPGLTPFKIAAEYVICAVLAGAFTAAWRMRDRFSPVVLRLVLSAIAVTVLSELAFTQYVSVYGDFNKLGHVLKVASFILVFNATVVASLRHPYAVLFRDLKQREAQLQENAVRLAEANRTKDEFLATLSHELRTPLHAILGWSELLLRGDLDATRSRQAVETIARNARAQATLVNDVLDVSRIITGKLRLELRRIDVTEVARAALEAARPAAVNKGIEIEAVSMESSFVTGDPNRLQQVVWNLISNAVKFTPPGGRIELSVCNRGSEVDIQVRDTGIGLTPEARQHLFERFWQADASSSRQHRGLGLGLAIVRHLVELHGGRVWAESPGPNLGATFTVSIPARAPEPIQEETSPKSEAEATEQDAAPGFSLDGVKVLVVDDEPDARELLSKVLSQMGALTSAAASAADGLARVRRGRPDVILSDIGMPGEDGYGFIAALRAMTEEEGGRTPAIAVTAYGRREDQRRAVESGFNAHLTKPVTGDQVVSAIRTVLGVRS